MAESWIVEVTFCNSDGEDDMDPYGPYSRESRARHDADRLEKSLEKVPEDPMAVRRVSVSVRRLNGPVRIRGIVAEAERFMEPDESGSDGFSSSGMYSIDHGGSGHE